MFKIATVQSTLPTQPCARLMAGDCSRSQGGQTLVPLPPCVPASPVVIFQFHYFNSIPTSIPGAYFASSLIPFQFLLQFHCIRTCQ